MLIVAMLLCAPTFAHADREPAPDAKKMHTDDCALARKQNKKCVIDMGKAEDITGKSPVATGTSIGALKDGKQPSLIRIRREFITEILKSAEGI